MLTRDQRRYHVVRFALMGLCSASCLGGGGAEGKRLTANAASYTSAVHYC